MRIGVDLGGTKVEAVAIDAAGRERVRQRVPTPATSAGDRGYEAVLAAVVQLVAEVEGKVGSEEAPHTLGIGTPGAVSPRTGLLKNSNSTCLNGRPLERDLVAAFGRPLRLANDADCLALSEARDGAGAGADSVFGVILGTGTGGGLVVDGALHRGPNGNSGEWGHNPLPWAREDERPGPPCYCGKRGCIETFVSGTGLARDHSLVTGERRTAAEVAERAAAGDAGAVASLNRYLDRLARALASVINVVDPHVIVLGGGVSNVERIYAELPGRLPAYVFGGEANTPVRRARHGDSSGVRGAAFLWP